MINARDGTSAYFTVRGDGRTFITPRGFEVNGDGDITGPLVVCFATALLCSARACVSLLLSPQINGFMDVIGSTATPDVLAVESTYTTPSSYSGNVVSATETGASAFGNLLRLQDGSTDVLHVRDGRCLIPARFVARLGSACS
jgi:hypothetical protein